MNAPSLGSLGTGGAKKNQAKRHMAAERTADEREVVDVNKPFEIGYCTFDHPFFNTGDHTLVIGQHFSAGDSFTEGLIRRMIMHPSGFVETILESQLVANKITVAILYNPKNCSPLFDKYRSQYAGELET